MEVNRRRGWVFGNSGDLLFDIIQLGRGGLRETDKPVDNWSEWDIGLHWRGVADISDAEEKGVNIWNGGIGRDMYTVGDIEHF